MDFLDVVEQRRSIRTFYPKPVEIEKVGQLITIADHAPSVGDLHPWKFIVVTKPSIIQDVADACPYERWLYQAPLLIVICSLQEKAEVYYPGKGKLWSTQSCSAAAENLLLGAVALGLAGCWVSSFESAKLKGVLHVPSGVEPEIILAIGYADEVPPRKSAQPFDSYVYFNDYGSNNVDWAIIKKDFGLYARSRYDDVKTRAAYETAERGGVRRGIDDLQERVKEFLGKIRRKERHEDLEEKPKAHHHTHHVYDFEEGHDHSGDRGPHAHHHGYGTEVRPVKDEAVKRADVHPRDRRQKPDDPDYDDKPESPTSGSRDDPYPRQ
jgi:nitroreductase